MSKAAKRERQRLNREARREAELVAAKRRQRFRLARNVGVLMLPLAVLFVVLQVVGDEDEKAGAAGCEEVRAPDPKTQSFPSPPTTVIDPAHLYTATIDTTCGKIEMLLDTAQAPTTVNNFVFLAREGFYDGTTFHRAAKDFVIQGGDPAGDGSGGPGYSIAGEVPSEVVTYQVGSVAMAKGGQDPAGTAGSQFFIVSNPPAQQGEGLDVLNQKPYQYALLGQLADDGGRSLRVARQIESLAPEGGDGPPTKTVVIQKVTIDEKTPASTTTTAPPPSSVP
ncbi:MAG: peptidylprolyl isomerase [Acidimicrobiia bacterium]